jgi:NitT/TauT family transport system substrate-binding protein
MKKPTFLLIVFSIVFSIIFSTVGIITCSTKNASRTPLKIGMIDWPGYDSFILADTLGLYKKNGINVENNMFSSATEVVQALKDKDIQGACLSLNSAFSLIELGIELKIVLILDYSNGGDMIIGQKNVTRFKQLQGKTIGYEKSVFAEFLLHHALQKNNVRASEVSLINIPKPDWITAFKSKQVDALVCFNPISKILLNNYDGNILFSSAEMPNEIIDVLVFSESYYNSNKDIITRVIQSHFDALAYFNSNTNKAIDLLSTAHNIEAKDYKMSLQGIEIPSLSQNIIDFDGNSPKNIYKNAQSIVDFMIYKSFLSNRINTTKSIIGDLLLEVENSQTIKTSNE